ncbi:MAG: NAD(P)/FAD-dependent oxidoreductase, partial [Candidatus Omnitrophota bacterium]
GGLRLGPDDEYLTTREKNYNLDETKKREFYYSAKVFMPFLDLEDLSGDTVGIRPKLQGPGEDFRDFVIQEEDEHGLRRLINLIGIESPGFTASLAIAGFVRQIVRLII